MLENIMRGYLYSFVVLFIIVHVSCHNEHFQIVKTVSGELKGIILKTWTSKDFFAFRGIPFAEPPIGNLRFQAPITVKPWIGVRDATKDGSVCPQPGADFVGPSDENCLILNVFTKTLQGNQPVIVYFHPGAFYGMTGASFWNGPDYLMDQDIVLVTVNYRLDALGFLTTGDNSTSSNNGLKDQVEALRWVQKHIKSFGGDSNKVTIAGYSAGSTSGFLHMLSPMSKGLFRSVIAMSAGVTSNWVITKDPQSYAKKLAGLFNCSTDTNEKMIQCLRGVPAKDINNKFAEMRVLGGLPMVVFGPVIESHTGNDEERFLIDDPVTLIKKKQFHQVPVVTGITEYEFLSWSFYVLNNETMNEILINNFDNFAPALLGYENKPKAQAQAITDSFKKFYFSNKPLTKDSTYELGQLYSDYSIIYGEYTTATLLAQYNSKPVYFYKLTYNGCNSHLTDPKTNKTIGPVHHDDLLYIFYISKLFPKLKESDPEAFMVKLETSFWKNFALTGNPTPDGVSVDWSPMTENNKTYLNIDTVLTMKEGLPFLDRMQLWESLFPIA